MNRNTHLMVDLETLGTKPGCGILSIGASTFGGKHQFYVKIDPSSLGNFSRDSETMAWWQRQTEEAKREAFGGKTPIRQALKQFHDFYGQVRAEGQAIHTWGNGADFDVPILEKAYEILGMRSPIAPFTNRCFRTLKELPNSKRIKDLLPQRSGAHMALEDAKWQAQCAIMLLRNLDSEFYSEEFI